MQSSIKTLKKKFENIKKEGWIETKRKGSTGIGYTFEQLINKKEENLPIPDFADVKSKQ